MIRAAVIAATAAALALASPAVADPVDPVVQAHADATAAWVESRLRVPIERRTVEVRGPQDMPRGAGGMIGDAAVPCGGGRILVQSWVARRWRLNAGRGGWHDPEAAKLLVHEVLHRSDVCRVELVDGAWTVTWLRDLRTEEGVVEAVALDLMAAWGRRFLGHPLRMLRYPAPPYRDYVRDVRVWSARYTGRPWRHREARLARRALLLADEATRGAMLAAVGE
jgi:hypothetical protein